MGLELGQGIYDDDGNVEALEGVILDYTDRRKRNVRSSILESTTFSQAYITVIIWSRRRDV